VTDPGEAFRLEVECDHFAERALLFKEAVIVSLLAVLALARELVL
jgi:hypothetical protein